MLEPSVGGGAFLNQTLIPVTIERFKRLGIIRQALENLNKHELTFEASPTMENAIKLGIFLARGAQGPSDLMEKETIPDISWRTIPRAIWGVDGENVDEESFVRVQIALANKAAKQINQEDPFVWHWSKGFNVIRRLENAVHMNANIAAHLLETAEGPWSPSRRAVSATLHVLWALHGCGASRLVRRTVAHTTLGLTLQGYRLEGGLSLKEAAPTLLQRFTKSPFQERTGVDPHRLRVCALCYHLAHDVKEVAKELELTTALIDLFYEMELRRSPKGEKFALRKIDLLNSLFEDKQRFGEQALRLFMHVCGVLPSGTQVRLSDGDQAEVMGPGPDRSPWLPEVKLDERIFVPKAPVQLWKDPDPTASGGQG